MFVSAKDAAEAIASSYAETGDLLRVDDRHDLDPRIGEDAVEQGGELPVPVPDQESRRAVGVLGVHDEILRGLHHPGRGRVGGCCQDADPPEWCARSPRIRTAALQSR